MRGGRWVDEGMSLPAEVETPEMGTLKPGSVRVGAGRAGMRGDGGISTRAVVRASGHARRREMGTSPQASRVPYHWKCQLAACPQPRTRFQYVRCPDTAPAHAKGCNEAEAERGGGGVYFTGRVLARVIPPIPYSASVVRNRLSAS